MVFASIPISLQDTTEPAPANPGVNCETEHLGTAQRNVSAAIVVSAQNCAGTNTMSFVLVGAILLLVFLMPPARLNGRAQTREDLKAG